MRRHMVILILATIAGCAPKAQLVHGFMPSEPATHAAAATAPTAGTVRPPLSLPPPEIDTAAGIRKWADAEVARVKAAAEVQAQQLREQGRLAAIETRETARTDYAETVKRWTGWAMGLILACAVAALIASFVPFTRAFVSAKDAAIGFAAVAALSLGRYALLRYGTLAADVAVWAGLAMAILAALAFGIPLGVSFFRRHVRAQAVKVGVEKNDPRAGAALLAVADGITRETPDHKAIRKDLLQELMGAASPPIPGAAAP